MKTGYKATYDFICLNHKFEIGETYELPDKPIPCQYGFHYCLKPIDVLEYYPINPQFRLLEIEDLSEDTVVEEDKSVTNRIRIIREVPKEEYYELMGFVGNELTRTLSHIFWKKLRFDERNNCIYFENSNGYFIKHQYDERNNLIYCVDIRGYWSKYQYDERQNLICHEDSNGYCVKRQYDELNNLIYCEYNGGYWFKQQYNENNKLIYYENSDGCWQKNQYENNQLIKTEHGKK